MVFLTLLGVVTLEDMTEWSTDAINHAFNMHRYTGLDFAIASDQSFAGIRQTIALSIRLLPSLANVAPRTDHIRNYINSKIDLIALVHR